MRWMASETTFRARFSPSDRAWCSMSRIIRAASRLAWFPIAETSSVFACTAVSPATRSRVVVRCSSRWSISAAALQLALPLVQLGGPVFQPVQLLVEPLLAPGQPVLPPLEVTAQLADLVFDGPYLALDLTASLGGLFGGFLGLGADLPGLGFGLGADLPGRTVRFLGIGRIGVAALAALAAGAEVLAARAGLVIPGEAAPGGAFRVAVADLRKTMTRANTVASSPITMNASAIPPLTVTPFRSSGPVSGHWTCVTRGMPWREGYCTRMRAAGHRTAGHTGSLA